MSLVEESEAGLIRRLAAGWLGLLVGMAMPWSAQAFSPLSGPLTDCTTATSQAAVNSGELLADSRLFRSSFDRQDWSGRVEAYTLEQSGELGRRLWSSDERLTPIQQPRLYQTWRQAVGALAGAAVPLDAFTADSFGPAQRQQLSEAAQRAGLPAGQDQALLDWARGEAVASLRPRQRLLGDVINAELRHVAPAQAVHDYGVAGYTGYWQFKQASMTSLLVLGANDGFLHVLDAETGNPQLAYLPAAAISGLGQRARVDYGHSAEHSSGMDGPITLADAQIAGQWSTVAIAGMGAGGQGLSAVRLFDQARGAGALGGLWDVHASDPAYADLGYSYGQPQVAYMDGRWVVISGNGYGSRRAQAALYVLALDDGRLLRQLDVGEAGANGLSAPVLVHDTQGQVQAAYAGDLQGRLWKFELSGAAAGWRVAFAGEPLFQAAAGQPISVAPVAVRHPQGGHLLLFGTGKFLETTDRTDLEGQAFYAIWDRPGGQPAIGPADLLAQRITDEFDTAQGSARQVSQARVDWTTQRGWYLPLGLAGERVTRAAQVSAGRVLFTTAYLRSDGQDTCLSEAGGWLMVLDLYSGAMLPTALLGNATDGQGDENGDETGSAIAGLEQRVGLPGEILLLDVPDPTLDEAGQAVSGGAQGLFCDNRHEVCQCPERASACHSEHRRPACVEQQVITPGSGGLARQRLSNNCRFTQALWRQLM